MRKVKQCLDEMKIVEKNLDDIWDERWGEKRSDEMRWDEVRSVKCEEWSVEFQVWHVEQRTTFAQSMHTGLDGATADTSYKVL